MRMALFIAAAVVALLALIYSWQDVQPIGAAMERAASQDGAGQVQWLVTDE